MLIFTAVLITLLIVGIFAVFVLGVGGFAFIFTFGDVIIAVLLILGLIKLFFRKKK